MSSLKKLKSDLDTGEQKSVEQGRGAARQATASPRETSRSQLIQNLDGDEVECTYQSVFLAHIEIYA